MRGKMLAFAVAAGLASSMGSALGGNPGLQVSHDYVQTRLAPPPTKRASRTQSADSPFGYPSGPGWSVARVQRMARKARNQRRNKRAHRG